jgi:hypothetical protein
MRPFPSKAPTASLPPLPLRLLPGGANQFPGGSFTRCSPAPFHGALLQHLAHAVPLRGPQERFTKFVTWDHVGIEQHSGEGCSNEASLDSKEFRTLSS